MPKKLGYELKNKLVEVGGVCFWYRKNYQLFFESYWWTQGWIRDSAHDIQGGQVSTNTGTKITDLYFELIQLGLMSLLRE